MFPRDSTLAEAAFQKALKETRFGLLKEIALSIKDGILALPFWEQLFLLYFDAQTTAPGIGKHCPRNN